MTPESCPHDDLDVVGAAVPIHGSIWRCRSCRRMFRWIQVAEAFTFADGRPVVASSGYYVDLATGERSAPSVVEAG